MPIFFRHDPSLYHVHQGSLDFTAERLYYCKLDASAKVRVGGKKVIRVKTMLPLLSQDVPEGYVTDLVKLPVAIPVIIHRLGELETEKVSLFCEMFDSRAPREIFNPRQAVEVKATRDLERNAEFVSAS